MARIRFEKELFELGLAESGQHEFEKKEPAQEKPCPQTVEIKVGRKRRKITVGELRFTKKAKDDLIKNGALLDGPDQAFVGWLGDKLGYDITHTSPVDPFRWDKLKFIIDSCAKVLVDKKDLIKDRFDVVFIHKGNETKLKQTLREMGASGYTLVTKSLDQSIYPSATTSFVSSKPDINFTFYSTTLSTADKSSLAHELLGHMWLALQKAPFVHPDKPQEIIDKGTIAQSHNILDPFGNVFTGTVKDFIGKFLDRSTFGSMNTPTQNVGVQLYAQALATFQQLFTSKSTGKLNGSWSAPPDVFGHFEFVSANHLLAPGTSSSGISKATIEADLTKFYNSLTPDQQYVFLRMMGDVNATLTRKTGLADSLLKALTPPSGMRTPPSFTPP